MFLRNNSHQTRRDSPQLATDFAMICTAATIILGSYVLGAAPAGADTNPGGDDPNPFTSLGCGCQDTTPHDSPALMQELQRGIQAALSASPSQPTDQ